MAILQRDVEKLAEERDGALKSLADKEAELAAFQKAAQEREAALRAACPPPESGCSLNVSYTVNADGTTLTGGQLTLRADKYEQALDVMSYLSTLMAERKWKVTPAPEKPPERAQAQEAKPANGDKPATPPIKAHDETKAIIATFPASSLSATITDGKIYWKVKGGRFGKWGVTIWPETLDAAGFGALEAAKPYDLSGWMAEYVEKEGKPDKVIRLYKAGMV